VARRFDHSCTVVNAASATDSCDSNMDGTYGEKCVVGALCQAGGTGCGTGGKCEGTIQLPSGISYDALHDASVNTESKLLEGAYVICVCLGTTGTDGPPTGYNGANGNGGCDTANEFTIVSSPTEPGRSIKVISEPRLGRFAESSGQQTVRHIAGMSHKYNIRTNSVSVVADFQIKNGDKIYFAPSSVGCGQLTKYSGPGQHTYNHATNSYISTGVDRRWRAITNSICLSVSSNAGDNCDGNNDGVFLEPCVVDAFCDASNLNNGGCGSTGVCGSPIPAAHAVDRTAMIVTTAFSAVTNAAEVVTPGSTKLTTVQSMVACFATAESLLGTVTDTTDFVALQDGLEVIASPRLGPVNSPGHIRALESSSPSFAVNTMKYGDLIYFVPQMQTPDAVTAAANTFTDCAPHVCTVVDASQIGHNCDATYNNVFTDLCVFRARCNPANQYNGGCGAGGTCQQQVPTVSSPYWTGLLNGTGFNTVGGSAVGEVVLPSSSQLAVPPVPTTGSAYYLAACFVPAGAIQSMPYNVHKLADMLTVFKEPIDSLVTSWFQYHVLELRFTQPTQGLFGTSMFATGDVGDMVVLKKGDCTGAYAIDALTYAFNQTFSSRMYLERTGDVTLGDEKGAVAGIYPLAQGKVNELNPGNYKICYATKNSGGESESDFKELAATLEILPPPSTTPRLTVPRTVMLGHDVVIHWEANIGLQERVSAPSTWIGLFKSGECTDENEWRHECYKAYQFIEAGTAAGTVRFSQSDYKVAGDYDVRYFVGDSRNGQGEICKGLTGHAHETYIQCLLDPLVTSSSIHIHGPDMRDLEDLESEPGIEVVFAGNRGRFN